MSLDFLSKTLIRRLEELKGTRHARKGTDPCFRRGRRNLPSPAQWALDLIDKARRRPRALTDGKEVRALPGEFDDTEDADVEELD